METRLRMHLCRWAQFHFLRLPPSSYFGDRLILWQPLHFAEVYRPKIGHEVWYYQLPNLAGWEETECVREKLSEVRQVFHLNADAVLIGQKLNGTLHHILIL